MSECRKVICDMCQKDLTKTWDLTAYSIRVANRSIPHVGTSLYAIYVKPHLDHDLDFCNLECLKNFLGEEVDK